MKQANKRVIAIVVGVASVTVCILIATSGGLKFEAGSANGTWWTYLPFISRQGSSSPTPTPTNTPIPSPPADMIGIQAAGSDAWSTVLSWGGRVVSHPGYAPKDELLEILDQAQMQGVRVIDRWPGRGAFQSGDGGIDLIAAREVAERLYGDGRVASHPAYAGSYMIDEPGNPQIWQLQPGDLDEFYAVVKSVDPNIKVVINFSWLEAARNLQAANACDVAGLTYTGVRPPGHWESQAAIAAELKAINPDLIVSPWIAVWGYPAQKYPIPTADWVREQGMAALSFDVFDGVFFFPWQHYPFTGTTIQDVADDPDYISAFKEVFQAAR